MLRPATFILKVYKAEDLPRSLSLKINSYKSRRQFSFIVDSTFLHGMKKMFSGTDDMKELIDPYVKFSFAGQEVNSI